MLSRIDPRGPCGRLRIQLPHFWFEWPSKRPYTATNNTIENANANKIHHLSNNAGIIVEDNVSVCTHACAKMVCWPAGLKYHQTTLLGIDIARRKHNVVESAKLIRRFRRELSVSVIGPKQMHSVLGYDHCIAESECWSQCRILFWDGSSKTKSRQ